MATLLLKTTTLTSVDLSVTRGCFRGGQKVDEIDEGRDFPSGKQHSHVIMM